jgi:hypothetical protein
MADTNAASEQQAARDHIFATVAQPAFFQKLASHGVPVEKMSSADRGKLLQIGDMLFQQHVTEQTKQAAARGSLLDEAYAGLFEAVGQQSQVDEAEKFAAQAIKADPKLIKSAAAIQQALLNGAA